MPPGLDRYRKMICSGSADFSESHVYPIADVTNPTVLEDVIRHEEVTHGEFGLIYQSQYNTLLVDPIAIPQTGEQGQRQFFPYERVLPTAGNGVVMATIHQGKFVLLKQYRHALRRYQLCLPRGFSEPGADGRENVLRELSEELHAVPLKEPCFLGTIAPDSGLTSRVTEVYQVSIETYRQTHQEGIEETVEVDAAELSRLIKTGAIDDGYTIGAFALWQLSNASAA